MEISHPNYNSADDDTKAAWVVGFLDAFGRLAFRVNYEPYSAFLRSNADLSTEETFHWCISEHHPYRDGELSTIYPLAERMLRRTLENEIYGWLYRFLGFRNPTQPYGKPDLYFNDGFTDPTSTHYISHEEPFRKKIVKELVDTVLAIAKPETSTLMVTAWGCYFHMRSRHSDWILILTCGY